MIFDDTLPPERDDWRHKKWFFSSVAFGIGCLGIVEADAAATASNTRMPEKDYYLWIALIE